MTDISRDPVVRRAIDDLQKLPPNDEAAIRRVVTAAAAARIAPAGDESDNAPARRPLRGWTIAGIAAAAAFAGFALRASNSNGTSSAGASNAGASNTAATAPASGAAGAPAPGAIKAVANDAAEARPIAQAFVFSGRSAHSVSVVGDFNGWSAGAARMVRAADGDLWSVAIPIMPGRHIYGFMVDDSVFVLDPHAPKARDPDLGADGSVIIVGKP